MNHTHFLQISTRSITLLSFGVGAVIASLLAGIFLFQAHAAPQSDGRLITIHDRGQEKVIISKAQTVGDALKSAHIVTLPDDTVDPDLDAKLTSNAYQINVYRAQPVLVVDGNTRTVVMSPHQTPKQIAEKAGLTLYDEDDAQLVRTSDLLQSDGAGLELSIDRATQFNFVFYGKQINARTQEMTVADMLQAKNITLGKNDALSVAANTKITPGIKVEVWRNGKQTISEEQPIAFTVQQTQDASQPIGYKLVKTLGTLGKKVVTYEVDMRNGKEIARREIQSVQTLAPQPQSEVIGSKQVITGNCGEWINGAGIKDIGSANQLIMRESKCNPYSVNRSSGACGIGQEHPCGKSGCALGDGACQTKWMNSYVIGRYGSWSAALAFHNSNGWY